MAEALSMFYYDLYGSLLYCDILPTIVEWQAAISKIDVITTVLSALRGLWRGYSEVIA